MGFIHIRNLYQDKSILLFNECYALEKLNGSSANVAYSDNKLTFFAGGESQVNFESLFDKENLLNKLSTYGADVIIFGEVHGGKCQGMSVTYGVNMKFAMFNATINGVWQSVEDEVKMANDLGLEYVHFERIPTTIDEINKQRDADSVQAVRNGMGEGHKREGVVLRPIVEMLFADGSRVISKHKRDEFRETKTPRVVSSVETKKLDVLSGSNAIADEWVTPTRLQHVLDKLPGHNITQMKLILNAMVEDILREGKDEIVDSKEARNAITKRTSEMYKELLKSQLK